MKTLDKKKFLIFLKTISEQLDKEEIKHELPYCHIDKDNFNHMFIIIPDHLQTYDISKIFNCNNIKEETGIIKTKIDDFDIFFVKCSDQNWYYNFWYYSWNILPFLIDILYYNSFGCRYTRIGLKYVYKGKTIHITKNMKDIFDFIELKFHMISTGFPTDYTIFSFIQSTPFFHSDYFTIENFKKIDPFYDWNKKYYKDFIKHKGKVKIEKMSIEKQISNIDAYFPKSNFLEKLSRIQLKEEFPNMKEKDFIIKSKKTIENIKDEKKEEILKKRKKINLRKIVKNKNDNDFNFKIE